AEPDDGPGRVVPQRGHPQPPAGTEAVGVRPGVGRGADGPRHLPVPPLAAHVLGDRLMRGVAIACQGVWKSYRIYHQRSHTLKEKVLTRRNQYEEFWALQ